MTTTALPREGDTDPVGPVSYQVGASSPTGLWLGLSAAALVLLGLGLLLSVLTVLSRLPFLLALIPIVLAATLALLPIAGRPLQAWARPTAGHTSTLLTGQYRWCPAVTRHLLPASPDSTARPEPEIEASTADMQRLRLPAEYGRLALLAPHLEPATDTDGPALLLDRAAGTVTLVFAVAGVDRFPLLDSGEQDQLLTGWGSALTLLSRDPAVRRVQLLDRQTPHPAAPVSTIDAEMACVPADPEPEAASRPRRDADHHMLRAQIDALTVHRDSLLAVQYHLGTFAAGAAGLRAGREARPGPGLLTAARERAQHLSTQLLAGRLLARPLDPAELTSTLTGFLTATTARTAPTVPGAGALPLIGSRRNAWDHVRLDDTWHRSYAITDWPRTPSTSAWLAPLLLAAPTGSTRTFAVHLQPIGPAQAARLARTARIRADLDLADRHRLGLPPSAAADLTAQGAAGMDAELVAGHSAHQLSALLTCSAPSPEQLEAGSAQLREAALAARLSVLPLHGQHHLALAATLPLCRLRSTGPS